MVTMSEVGKVASVSATTVSHVINKTRKVDPDTEKAVLAAIQSTGYSGDGIARSLRKGTTETVGLAMSSISNPYFGDVVHAIERSLTEAGYSLLLSDTHDDPARELKAVQDLISHRVDAMILAPSADPTRTLALLTKRSIATVLIDRVPTEIFPGVDAIGVTNDEPNAQLVDHFARLGHTRIGTIASTPNLTTTIERLRGYRTGTERNGLDYDPQLVAIGDIGTGDQTLTDKALQTLLALPEPPTAIIMGNNHVTIAAMRALRRLGIEVPRDLAIASFDDFEWADLFHPRLTAVSQPVDDLGSGAVALLLERFWNRDLPPRHQRLEPTIRHRESCGCAEGDPF